MKLNIRVDNIGKYNFRELEYALKLLYPKLEILQQAAKGIKYDWSRETYIKKEVKPIENKVKLIEDELANRMLTGNDDGMFDREVLSNEHI